MIVGYPFCPLLDDHRANCGPAVAAALLGINCAEAIRVMDRDYKKGWNGYTNIGHIRVALDNILTSMEKVHLYDKSTLVEMPMAPTLFFLQVDGPWVDKGWRSAYTHTHWILAHKKMVMDVNNPRNINDLIQWVSPAVWKADIMPGVVASWEDATGWYVRDAFLVED